MRGSPSTSFFPSDSGNIAWPNSQVPKICFRQRIELVCDKPVRPDHLDAPTDSRTDSMHYPKESARKAPIAVGRRKLGVS
jgi:hypothetical protein